VPSTAKVNINNLKIKIMSKLKTQYGAAATADFSENTWTFEMYNSFFVSAGDFAIVPSQKYQALINMLDKINNIENAAFSLKGFDAERLKSEIKTVLDLVK